MTWKYQSHFCKEMCLWFPLFLLLQISARLENIQTIVCTSPSDIQRITKLSISDVSILHQVAAASISRPPVQTALELLHSNDGMHISTGCPVLDKQLRGGIACHGITEITGESASGKTQLCLQLCLSVQLPRDKGGLGRGKYMMMMTVTDDDFYYWLMMMMMMIVIDSDDYYYCDWWWW